MKWYGLNISKFCGIIVSSDTPVVEEPIFIAKIPAIRRAFKVLSNEYTVEQFNITPVRNSRTFKVTQTTAEVQSYNAVFKRNNREFKVIQN